MLRTPCTQGLGHDRALHHIDGGEVLAAGGWALLRGEVSRLGVAAGCFLDLLEVLLHVLLEDYRHFVAADVAAGVGVGGVGL